MKEGMSERGHAQHDTAAGIVRAASLHEAMNAPAFHFGFRCVGPAESDRAERVRLLDRIQRSHKAGEIIVLRRELDLIPLAEKWADEIHNTVLTAGKNDLLDKYFAGSGYTAAWYLGLISSVSYSAINAADTIASHAGWTEAGATNAPNYSAGTRPALSSWNAASGGSKATNAAVSYTMSGAGTLKGAFAVTNSTKDGTTGIAYSAGLFSGGDRVVASSDVVNVSGSWGV